MKIIINKLAKLNVNMSPNSFPQNSLEVQHWTWHYPCHHSHPLESRQFMKIRIWLKPYFPILIRTCKYGHQVALLALFPRLITKWRYLHWLQIWSRVAPLSLLTDLATGWLHLFWLQIWPPGTTKFNIRWRYLH